MILHQKKHALGSFLRARRNALAPQDFGFQSTTSRRRTKGLRREEVAQICGVSITWYTWLEQGRDISCSASTLGRIANALRLSQAERFYIFELAQLKDNQKNKKDTYSPSSLPTKIKKLPNTISVPSYILDSLWNAQAANQQACELFPDWLAQPERNLLRFVFLSPSARTFLVDWEASAQRTLAEFRTENLYNDIHGINQLIDELSSQSPDFKRLWDNQTVQLRSGGIRYFQHPKQGLVTFDQTTLNISTHPEYKLVILNPA